MCEQSRDLAAVEHGGQAGRALRLSEVLKSEVIPAYDLLLEEHQGVDGLVSGRGGDIAPSCEVIEEGDDSCLTHLPGMALAVEQD